MATYPALVVREQI